MSGEPLVSVCVVTRNHESYIRNCLMSVIAQSSDVSLEILVGDDCSDDGTTAIIDEVTSCHPGIVRRIQFGERLGCGSRSYLRLIAQARGAFIAHLDGDDFWLPGKLREQVAYLLAHPDITAVYANAVVVDAAGRIRGSFNANVPEVFDLGYLLRGGNFLCHASLLYRAEFRSLFLHLPTPFLDFRFHIELARRGRLGYVDHGLTGYRVASATSMSVSNSTAVRQMYLDALLAVGIEAVVRNDLRRAYGQFLAVTLWDLVAQRQWRDLAILVRRAWREVPEPKWQLGNWLLVELVNHLGFKMANFLAARMLRRPLKIYFPR